jgi:hypothetical protein
MMDVEACGRDMPPQRTYIAQLSGLEQMPAVQLQWSARDMLSTDRANALYIGRPMVIGVLPMHIVLSCAGADMMSA